MITEKQHASAKQAATDLVEGFTWDDATLTVAVRVIDMVQAWVVPWITRLNATLGSYVGVALQTIEDALKKMLPPAPPATPPVTPAT